MSDKTILFFTALALCILSLIILYQRFIYAFILARALCSHHIRLTLIIGSLSFYVQLVLKSAVIVSMSFIALFVGMAVKSSKAAIITSFLLIFLTQANVGNFTMADNTVFPVVLTVISLGFAILSIYNVENNDLI